VKIYGNYLNLVVVIRIPSEHFLSLSLLVVCLVSSTPSLSSLSLSTPSLSTPSLSSSTLVMLLPPLLALLASLLSGLSLYTAIFVLLIGKFQLINMSTILWLRSVPSHRKKSFVKRYDI
jgi:hypothetical protein